MNRQKKKILSLVLAIALVITEISIPTKSVKANDTAEDLTETDLSSFDYMKNSGEDTYAIVSCNSSDETIVVPSQIEGMDVTVISSNAFTKSGTDKVKKIVLPDTITTINTNAFVNLDKVEEIVLPESLTTVGTSAFCNCDKLTNITFHSLAVNVDYMAIFNCKNFESVNFDEGNTAFKSVEGVWYNKAGTTMIWCPPAMTGDFYIGANVDTIELNAQTIFNMTRDIDNIVVDENNQNYASVDGVLYSKDITTIYACPSTKKGTLDIPATVKNIDGAVFDKVLDVTAFNVNQGNPYFTSVDGVIYSKDMTIIVKVPNGKTGDFVIPDSVTEIEESAFSQCPSLRSVEVPDGIENIDNLSKLTSNVYIYVSSFDKVTDALSLHKVIELGNDASVYRYELSEGNVTIANYYGKEENVVIPSTIDGYPVVAIEGYAFSDSSCTKNVTIPASVTYISANAFRHITKYCNSIENIIIDENNTVYKSMDGAVYDKSLEKLIIVPAGIENLTIPESVVTQDNEEVFNQCNKLTTIVIPSTYDYLQAGILFSTCSNLKNVSFSEENSRFSVNDGIIYNSNGTELMYIPLGYEGEVNIDENVNNVYILNIHSKGITSYNVDSENTTYASADGTLYSKDLKTLMKCPGSATGNYNVPTDVKKISARAFWDCTGLTNILICDNVNNIGEFAFYGCTGLTEFHIPATITEITTGLLSGCDNISEIVVPEGVTTIHSRAFECKNLTRVDLPETCSFDNFFDYMNSTDAGCTPFCADMSNLVIGVRANSKALEYAKEIQANYEVINPEGRIYVDFDMISISEQLAVGEVELGGITTCSDANIKYNVISGTDVIEVSQLGIVSLKKTGTAIIEASIEATENYTKGQSRYIVFKVTNDAQKEIKTSKDTYTMYIGNEPFSVNELGVEADGALSYNVADTDVISYENGMFTINKTGSTKVTIISKRYGYEDVTKDIIINIVKKTQNEITYTSPNENSVHIGKTFNLNAIADGKITYTSLNPDFATVDTEGNVTITDYCESVQVKMVSKKNGYEDAEKVVSIKITLGSQSAVTTSESFYNKKMGDQAFSLGAKGDGTLTYKSWNESVATVDSKGVVTIVGVGNATIVITSQKVGYYDAQKGVSVKVTESDDKEQQDIEVTKTFTKTYGSKSFLLNAKGEGTLTYLSSKPSVATVSSTGQVTIKGEGTTFINITSTKPGYKDKIASVQIIVNKATQNPITTGSSSYTKKYGNTAFSLEAKGDGTLTYLSSNTKVVTVDSAGKVTIKGAGNATISITSKKSNYNDSIKNVSITVNKGTQKAITTGSSSYTKKYGNTAFSLEAKGDGMLTYSSSNASVVTVDTTGKVTIKGAGSAVITITSTKTNYITTSKQVTITVNKATQAAITTSKTSYAKVMGDTAFTLGAKGSGTLSYASSDTSVATVSSTGKVTVKSSGRTYITITSKRVNYNNATKKVLICVRPKKSTISTLTSTAKNKMYIRWYASTTVSGYQIQYSTSSNFTSSTTKTVTITSKAQSSKTISGLISGKTYYVRIRAYKTVSLEKQYGDYSSVKTIKVK